MGSLSRNAFRVAVGLLVLSGAVHVVTLWPRVAALGPVLTRGWWLAVAGYGVSGLTALLACALAAFLLWQAVDRREARVLALFLAFLAIFWGSLFRFLEAKGDANSVHVTLSYGTGWVSQSAAVALLLAMAAFVRFSALFPRPLTAERLPPARRWRALRSVRAATLRPLPVWGSVVVVALALKYLPDLVAAFALPEGPAATLPPVFVATLVLTGALFVLYGLVALIAGTRNLRASYRIAAAQERDRILWVVTGFTAACWMVLGAVGVLAAVALTDLNPNVIALVIPLGIVLAPLVLVVCATIGILYSGALDPAIALQRSTVWGAIGASGVIAFAGIENALSSLVEGRLGLPGIVGSMIAGAVVTALLIPLRRVVHGWVARRPAAGVADHRHA
jgi:hypothetical protein